MVAADEEYLYLCGALVEVEMITMSTTDIDEKAVRVLPVVKTFSEELVSLAADTMAEPVYFEESDHLAFMGLLSLGHQLHLFQPLLTLAGTNLAVPAGFIARSMLEGLAQLFWCSLYPDSRPLEWRTFALVHDYRLMKKRRASGERIDPSEGIGPMGVDQWDLVLLKAS